MLTNEQINHILGVNDSYKQPAKLLSLMLDEKKRVETFQKFFEYETDMSFEWFQEAFEIEHAERKDKKQDFTPRSIGKLLNAIAKKESDRHYYEVAAGNGGILIQAWQNHRINGNFWSYNPMEYWYQVEELSDRSLPFLIFNMAIRGMNGVILHGDSLTREFRDVYFIRNMSTQYGPFSEVIVMPKTETLMQEYDIRKWVV